MSALVDIVDDPKPVYLPSLRDSISIQKRGLNAYTVRDSFSRSYFQAGTQEAFLLDRLKQPITWEQLQKDFESEFSEKVSKEDFDDFQRVLRDRRFLALPIEAEQLSTSSKAVSNPLDEEDDEGPSKQGTILFYRVPLADPDRFLEAFTKAFLIFWSRSFLIASAMFMLAALLVLVDSRNELVATFQSALRFETVVMTVLAILVATAIHETGHGATCKRFGGSVHESGLLFMFFMPCLYVNVSDAWFILERWKRLAITFAGGYCDLCVWATSVFVWRVTQNGTQINYLAFVLLSTCGTRALLNFNPLMRLDGSYLLSDLLDYPNLYSRARNYWIGTLNTLLWGAPKPEVPPRKWLTLSYGFITWFFAIGFLNYIGLKLVSLAGNHFGIVGLCFSSAMLLYGLRRVFRGFLGSEFIIMFRKRLIRTSL
ncbi:MAG: hypothetical protein SGI77_24605 [Pirellulaceae bacterium]|nr:hypothetical protein [Pirellulaceae bacterium]